MTAFMWSAAVTKAFNNRIMIQNLPQASIGAWSISCFILFRLEEKGSPKLSRVIADNPQEDTLTRGQTEWIATIHNLGQHEMLLHRICICTAQDIQVIAVDSITEPCVQAKP